MVSLNVVDVIREPVRSPLVHPARSNSLTHTTMRSSTPLLALAVGVALLLTGCDSAGYMDSLDANLDGNVAAGQQGNTIVETVLALSGPVGTFDDNPDNFNILREALVETGLIVAFDGTQYTVFAPTDGAFYALTGTDNDADALEAVINLVDGDLSALANILRYHVVNGRRTANSVVPRGNAPDRRIQTLLGQPIFVNSSLAINDGQATIEEPNVLARDGVIHVINGVLLPSGD